MHVCPTRGLIVALLSALPVAAQGQTWITAIDESTRSLWTLDQPDYFVLQNRQKYIGLAAYFPGIEYDSISFSIIRPPQHGQLIGTPPNLVYIPAAGYTGLDSFVYYATAGAAAIRRTINLSVSTQIAAPVGVVAPQFGVLDSHMMYAGKTYNFGGRIGIYRDAGNGPYTHYVDFDNGNDVNNPFGTNIYPRKSIPSTLPAGSVVELHGTLRFPVLQRQFIRGSATASAPIFIRGASAANKAILRRPLSIECNYVICENIEFDCQDFGPGTNGANWFWVTNTDAPPYTTFHHVSLRHSLIHDQPTMDLGQNPSGIVVGVRHFDPALNDSNLLIQNVVIYDVEIRNFAIWNDFSGTDDYSACLLTANSVNSWVLDCHFHHMRGPAIGVSRASALSNQPPARYAFMGRNYIHNCKEVGLDFKNGTDSVFSQNTCHTFRKSFSSSGSCAILIDDDQTANFPGADNVWLLFNMMYDAENGIYHELRNWTTMPAGKHSRSYMIGNLLFDIRMIQGSPNTDGVAIHKGQLGESRIIGNTIYRCDQGIWLGLSNLVDPSHTTQVVRNNAIVNLNENYLAAKGDDAMHIYLTPNSILPYTTIDHNVHYEDVGRVHFTVSQPTHDVDYYSVTDLFIATGLDAVSSQVNPPFVDPGGLDFHLGDTSTVFAAGIADDAYSLFPSYFSNNISFYLDGSPKPFSQCALGALPQIK